MEAGPISQDGMASSSAGCDASAPLEDNALAEDSTGMPDAVEEAKQITMEAFEKGMRKILELSIRGYPQAIRSTAARRNELLRKYDGAQEPAVEDVKAQAAAITEEAKTWLLGLVPYVGLPASVLWPTWRLLRRVCLLAGLYGHDMEARETQAKMLHVFGGLRAVPVGEHALEAAVQLVWQAFVGPVARMVPVGFLVSKVANIEGNLMAILGQETFSEGQAAVPSEVYQELLDPEPTSKDYLELAANKTSYAVLQAVITGGQAATLLWDSEKRAATVEQTKAKGMELAEQAQVLGRGVAAVAPGAAAAATELGKDGLLKGLAKGKDMLAGRKKSK